MTAEDLRAARRADSNARRQRVLSALEDLERNRQPITQSSVARAAGVHRNFFTRHRDLAALVEAAQQPTGAMPRATANLVSTESLRTDLALARQREADLEARVAALENQLRRAGITQHQIAEDAPELLAARQRIAGLEVAVSELRRSLARTEAEREAMRETNRELARQLIHPVD